VHGLLRLRSDGRSGQIGTWATARGPVAWRAHAYENNVRHR
jgi:hypothetical protein